MIFNAASDIRTRQTIWVARKVGEKQRNSHTCNVSRDGLLSTDWCGLYERNAQIIDTRAPETASVV